MSSGGGAGRGEGAAAVEARGLRFSYPRRRGAPVRPALAGVDFDVMAGEAFGFLGPNGGGKSTLFRILATLARPESGTLRVFGADLASQAREVRRRLGVVFQNPSLDVQLTVRENLVHQGHLHGLAGRDLAGRIDAALDRFGLREREGQRAKELSGGLRRRVEIAKALLHDPRLLLLDEPSTGLDPGARRDLWETLEALRSQGVTVLLTTHFMEEGDRCDRLVLLDRGLIVAEGSPAALKAEIGGDVVTLAGPDPEALAREVAARFPELKPAMRDASVRLEAARGHEVAARLAEALPGRIESVTVARPSLEDVFLLRTGRRLDDDEEAAA
ncbi:MAG: ATP-binding cassette domain-containing protein [Thermoanaerobaculia bacterium]